MPQTQKRMYRPRESFTGDYEGEPFVANPSEVFAEDHPLVKRYADLFVPVVERNSVVTMTAEPGTKR